MAVKVWSVLTQVGERMALCLPLCLALLSLYYRDRVEKELHVANVKCGDRVLCIGGGPCPFTSIHIHKLTGAHITVIDNNIHAVRAGTKLIKDLGLLSAITFLHAEGTTVDIVGYTLVHVAAQVTPRADVIRHIQRQSTPHTRILVRGTLPESPSVLLAGWRASTVAGLPLYPSLLLCREAKQESCSDKAPDKRARYSAKRHPQSDPHHAPGQRKRRRLCSLCRCRPRLARRDHYSGSKRAVKNRNTGAS